MPVVALGGHATSGKDTAAGVLISEYGYKHKAFAAKLKELALHVDPIIDLTNAQTVKGTCRKLSALVEEFGWEKAKKFTGVRKFLQELGQGAREIIGPDVWISAALKMLHVTVMKGVVFTDVRYLNELDALKEFAEWNRTPFYSIWISREGVGPVNEHASDSDISNSFQHIIYNNGTVETLWASVKKIVCPMTNRIIDHQQGRL